MATPPSGVRGGRFPRTVAAPLAARPARSASFLTFPRLVIRFPLEMRMTPSGEMNPSIVRGLADGRVGVALGSEREIRQTLGQIAATGALELRDPARAAMGNLIGRKVGVAPLTEWDAIRELVTRGIYESWSSVDSIGRAHDLINELAHLPPTVAVYEGLKTVAEVFGTAYRAAETADRRHESPVPDPAFQALNAMYTAFRSLLTTLESNFGAQAAAAPSAPPAPAAATDPWRDQATVIQRHPGAGQPGVGAGPLSAAPTTPSLPAARTHEQDAMEREMDGYLGMVEAAARRIAEFRARKADIQQKIRVADRDAEDADQVARGLLENINAQRRSLDRAKEALKRAEEDLATARVPLTTLGETVAEATRDYESALRTLIDGMQAMFVRHFGQLDAEGRELIRKFEESRATARRKIADATGRLEYPFDALAPKLAQRAEGKTVVLDSMREQKDAPGTTPLVDSAQGPATAARIDGLLLPYRSEAPLDTNQTHAVNTALETAQAQMLAGAQFIRDTVGSLAEVKLSRRFEEQDADVRNSRELVAQREAALADIQRQHREKVELAETSRQGKERLTEDLSGIIEPPELRDAYGTAVRLIERRKADAERVLGADYIARLESSLRAQEDRLMEPETKAELTAVRAVSAAAAGPSDADIDAALDRLDAFGPSTEAAPAAAAAAPVPPAPRAVRPAPVRAARPAPAPSPARPAAEPLPGADLGVGADDFIELAAIEDKEPVVEATITTLFLSHTDPAQQKEILRRIEARSDATGVAKAVVARMRREQGLG